MGRIQGTALCVDKMLVLWYKNTDGDRGRFSVLKNLLNKSQKISLKERLASADRFLLHTIRLGNGRLKEMTYANGNIMRATYNGYGQLIAEKWYSAAADTEPAAHYRYVYDNSGNIVRSIDIKEEKEYNYTYEEGRIVRATEYGITLDESLNVTAKTLVSSIDYAYNSKGLLSETRGRFSCLLTSSILHVFILITSFHFLKYKKH